MDETNLRNLSPLDGRYRDKTKESREIFSEESLINKRLTVELKWLKFFIKNFRKDLIKKSDFKKLDSLLKKLPKNLPLKVKEIEKTTNHDVKAVELALGEKFKQKEFKNLIHIFLTSEDVNSFSYAIMMKEIQNASQNWVQEVISILNKMRSKYADLAMLSKTHGQPASPTTLGKEINVFKTRLEREIKTMKQLQARAKWGGATGNYNVHQLVFKKNWVTISRKFLKESEVELCEVSTQIEPHDFMAEQFNSMQRISNILLDLSRDIWTYISMDYFKLKVLKSEVGSSTMPHKVNPIDFENAEGNLGLSNALFSHLSEKLPISRLQRDLSDSTVLRSIGSAYGYFELSVNSLLKGLNKLEANRAIIGKELDGKYEILTEAIQTFLRLEGVVEPYEKVKKISRGNAMDKETYLKIIDELVVDKSHKKTLKNLTPQKYVGIAEELAKL